MKKTRALDPLAALSLGEFTEQLRFLTRLLKYKANAVLPDGADRIIARPSYAMAEINRAFAAIPALIGKKRNWKETTLRDWREQAGKWLEVCPWPKIEIQLRDVVIPAIERALDRHPAEYANRGRPKAAPVSVKRQEKIFLHWQDFKANGGRKIKVFAEENGYHRREVETAINSHSRRKKRQAM